jgi:CheY-like chemotaxis protein
MRGVVEGIPGTKLLEADTGELGLALARAHRPDMIVLDINLPDRDGFTVLGDLRRFGETADIPVVALSASAMPEDIQRGIEAGFRRYLTKPLRIPELLDLIDHIAGVKAI